MDEDKSDKDSGKDDDNDEKTEVEVAVDFDGIFERQVKLPIDPGNYAGLWARQGEVYFMSFPLGGMSGSLEDAKRTLHVYDLEDREAREWLVDLSSYAPTPDGKKMLIRKSGGFEIVDAGGKKATTGETTLNLNGMEMLVDYRSEWSQMFEEVWRRQRDFFYDPGMHGVDWQLMHDRYAPLVDHVDHRFDLTYVIGEMISELSCSHTYVGGGDMPTPDPSRVGLLGIDWATDSTAGKYRIGRILDGENWRDRRVSPLREPGIKAAAGDYLLSIDGTPLSLSENPMHHLQHKAGEVVTLTLADNPSGKNSWDINVRTLSSETGLRYADWVEHNRRYVDSASNGRIGYVHIPDMGGNGLIQFTSTWFAQLRKEGMVVDVRYNGGGFVSQLILERMRRIVAGMTTSRNSQRIGTYPRAAFHGHMACLLNEHSCSDGDIFPYFFREFGLGPLIGKTTWGGVVGIRGIRSLVDGGFIYAPEFSLYDWDQDWVMENRGVVPDIDVDNLPEDLLAGRDAQLDRAIAEIMRKIETEPKTLPGRPAAAGQR